MDVAGIESLGLTSALAIGGRVVKIISGLLKPDKNLDFNGKWKGILNPKNVSRKQYSALIKKKTRV